MSEKIYKPQIPDIMEAIFDCGYLLFDLIAVTGIGVIILYAISGNTNGYHMTRIVVAIIISFGCYLPVTLFSKTKPKVGLLMIPKTCAYMWVIVMGLQLL